MPINPNIALGVQQQQQPVNYLAQMGQAMALKAAAQDIQGNEELRAAYAGGGNMNDPEFQRKIMAANPKLGSQLIKTSAETQRISGEALTKAYANSREALSMVRSPQELLAYSVSQFNDPLIGPSLRARGLTPESVAANLQKELSTSGFENVLKKSAMGLDGWFKDQTSRANAATAAAPGHRQASVAEQRLKMEQEDAATIANILSGGGVTPAGAAPATIVGGGGGVPTAPMSAPVGGGGVPIPLATGGVTPPAAGGVTPPAAGGVVTQPNVLAQQAAPTAAPAPNVNALTGNAQAPQIVQQISALIRTGKPKAIQAADALIKEYNILNPTQKIEQDATGALVTVNERTGLASPVLDKDGKPVMGKLPYESSYGAQVGKSQAERNEKVVIQAQAAPDSIRKIDDAIAILKQGGATTGLGAELRTNVDRARALLAGDIKAGKRVSDTQILDALLGSDVFPMIQSLGVGARGLDTPAERDYLRQVMTGTIQMDADALVRLSEIRRNLEIRAIEKYNKQLERGELNKYFETQGLKPEKIEVPTASGGAGSNTVSVGGVTYTFPNAEAAAKFKKEAGVK